MAAAGTRRRIIEAAKALHAERGIVGTSFQEIAARAGVAQATVYRHFSALADLIPACAGTVRVLRPATPDLVEEVFRGADGIEQRIERLVLGTCDCYARDAGWLHAARGEDGTLPELRAVAQVQEENLRLLVRAAIDGSGASERTVRLLGALVDFPVWKSLREAGFDEEEAAEQVMSLVTDQLEKAGIV